MPDEELLRCAEQNMLRDPAGSRRAGAPHAARIRKPRRWSRTSAASGSQFRALESVKPDPVRFMAFNDYLRISMKRETELFFENLLRADRSILDFLNGRLHVPQRGARRATTGFAASTGRSSAASSSTARSAAAS